jgi:hypothetical protein
MDRSVVVFSVSLGAEVPACATPAADHDVRPIGCVGLREDDRDSVDSRSFTMALDGSVSNVKLAGTSGNRFFDQSARGGSTYC